MNIIEALNSLKETNPEPQKLEKYQTLLCEVFNKIFSRNVVFDTQARKPTPINIADLLTQKKPISAKATREILLSAINQHTPSIYLDKWKDSIFYTNNKFVIDTAFFNEALCSYNDSVCSYISQSFYPFKTKNGDCVAVPIILPTTEDNVDLWQGIEDLSLECLELKTSFSNQLSPFNDGRMGYIFQKNARIKALFKLEKGKPIEVIFDINQSTGWSSNIVDLQSDIKDDIKNVSICTI